LFAVHPYDNPSRLLERFQPLCAYLTESLGRPVALYLAHSYNDQVRRITSGQVDLAYLGPTLYLRAQEHYLGSRTEHNIEILAGETIGEEIGYRTVVVALRSSPIQGLEDLRGRTFALGTHDSFGSHFVPRVMLLKAGLTLADLKDYAYLDRHERVALAVVHGDFDAGGLREDVALHYLDRGLKIVAHSPVLTPHVVVARPGLDRHLAEALRSALTDPSPTAGPAFAALGPGVGFASVDADAFDLARLTIRAMEGARPSEALPW
jgi:phosphonate transport system substrate-binding protein